MEYPFLKLQNQHVVYGGFPRNGGTPKSSILIGFSITNHPFWGTTIFGNIHIDIPLNFFSLPPKNPPRLHRLQRVGETRKRKPGSFWAKSPGENGETPGEFAPKMINGKIRGHESWDFFLGGESKRDQIRCKSAWQV